MSGLEISMGTGDNSMTIEDIAASWVVDRFNPEIWTERRQVELDAWLRQSIAHRVAYVRIEASWRRADRLAALRNPMRQPPTHGNSRKAFWTRIVAGFVFVVLSGAVTATYVSRPQAQLIETPKGGQERLRLADGSEIELNTDTAVWVNVRSNTRAIKLVRGEAYFQIKHDASRPFVVTAANHKIVDLGTKFLVRLASESLQVTLLEGRARLESARETTSRRNVILSPGSVVIATAGSLRIFKQSRREMAEHLAWQRGAIVFHNARLVDAVAEFNRYAGTPLVVVGSDAGNLTINGTFRTTGVEDFAANAREIFQLRVERRNGNIVLSR